MDVVQKTAFRTQTAMGTDPQGGFHFVGVLRQHVADFLVVDGRSIV
jgi:hypothetical protein